MLDNHATFPVEGSRFFLSDLLNDTIQLLLEAHEYFESLGLQDHHSMDYEHRALYSQEMSRITTRLSCIMAWLMAQKAVASGQLSQEEAMTDYRLDCKEACLIQAPEADVILPPLMRQLLNDTFRLYSRVNRLDDQMAEAHSTWH